MPDIDSAVHSIIESQYNSIENNFGIDIFECWDFRAISHLRHLFFKKIGIK